MKIEYDEMGVEKGDIVIGTHNNSINIIIQDADKKFRLVGLSKTYLYEDKFDSIQDLLIVMFGKGKYFRIIKNKDIVIKVDNSIKI